jgi:hypothetical protein
VLHLARAYAGRSSPKMEPDQGERISTPKVKLEFNIGVEIEFVFVFHEKLILGQLIKEGTCFFPSNPLYNGRLLAGDRLDDARRHFLGKELSDTARETLRQGKEYCAETQPYYNSWAVKIGKTDVTIGTYQSNDDNGFKVSRPHITRWERPPSEIIPQDGYVRTYLKEPARVAKEAILLRGAQNYWQDRQGPSWIYLDAFDGIDVFDGSKTNIYRRNPSWWYLTNDFSLSALTRNQMEDYLWKKKVCPERDKERTRKIIIPSITTKSTKNPINKVKPNSGLQEASGGAKKRLNSNHEEGEARGRPKRIITSLSRGRDTLGVFKKTPPLDPQSSIPYRSQS